MRIQNTIVVALFFATCLLTSSVFGLDVEYFAFTGWDHSQVISESGQTFTDIVGDVDVTVEAFGTFDDPSTFSGGSVRSNHDDPGSHTFRFTFSEPLRLVTKTMTVDAREIVSIFTSASETYFHQSGALPMISPNGIGIDIQGTSFGINPTGASFGETLAGASVSILTVTYQGLGNNKYNQFMVGELVPEPNSIALLGVGVLGMLLKLRKRNK